MSTLLNRFILSKQRDVTFATNHTGMKNWLFFFLTFNSLVNFAQDEKTTWNDQAIEFVYAKQFDSAVVYFSKVIALSPEDEIAYLDRGLAYEKQHLLNEALADFDRQQKIDPSMPDASFLKGIILEKLGDTLGALKEYLNVTQLDFYNSDAHFFAARCFEFVDKPVEADSAYARALQANPSHYYIVPHYVLFRIKHHQLNGIEAMLTTIPLDVEDPYLEFAKAKFAFEKNDFNTCFLHMQNAFKLGFYNEWMTQRTVHFNSKKMEKWLWKNYQSATSEKDKLVLLQIATMANSQRFRSTINNIGTKQNINEVERRILTTNALQEHNIALAWKNLQEINAPTDWDVLLETEIHFLNHDTTKMCASFHEYLSLAGQPVFYPYYTLCGNSH